ncbi:MAG: hypothetical protein HY909_26750 [Deltaproteobacteria bacterium]|nr:hypothetical protein [Deltaproteobacteria bacterium]
MAHESLVRSPRWAALFVPLLLASCGSDTSAFSAADASASGMDAPSEAASGDGAPAPDARGDAPRDNAPGDSAPPPRDVPEIDAGPSEDGVYDYVLDTFLADTDTGFRLPKAGFNVDGRFSERGSGMPEDCNHGDYRAAYDFDQNEMGCDSASDTCLGGVDNQLPPFVQLVSAGTGMDVQELINAELAGGTFFLLVRVEGVDGPLTPTLNDPEVTVSLYRGWAMLPRSMCRLAFESVATFSVDNASLRTPGDLASARGRFPGRIVGGRLQVTAGPPGSSPDNLFPLPLPSLGGVDLRMDVHQTQLRLDLGYGRATRGNFGGYLARSELVTQLRAGFPMFISILKGAVDGLVDLATGSPPSCNRPVGGIGVGLHVSAVRARLAPTTVSGPPAGMCGAP